MRRDVSENRCAGVKSQCDEEGKGLLAGEIEGGVRAAKDSGDVWF